MSSRISTLKSSKNPADALLKIVTSQFLLLSRDSCRRNPEFRCSQWSPTIVFSRNPPAVVCFRSTLALIPAFASPIARFSRRGVPLSLKPYEKSGLAAPLVLK